MKMQKIIRISIYLSVLAFYNLTTLYIGVIHDHKFEWTDDETCSAYLISVSQNSDTFSFTVNYSNITSNEKIFDFQNSDLIPNFEYTNIFTTRAPPDII